MNPYAVARTWAPVSPLVSSTVRGVTDMIDDTFVIDAVAQSGEPVRGEPAGG